MIKTLFLLSDLNYTTVRVISWLANAESKSIKITGLLSYPIWLLHIISKMRYQSEAIKIRLKYYHALKDHVEFLFPSLFQYFIALLRFYLQTKEKNIHVLHRHIFDRVCPHLLKKRKFNSVYGFDGNSYKYFTRFRDDHNLRLLLESRGSHVDTIFKINAKINLLYGLSLPDFKNKNETWWYKLFEEAKLADSVVVYSDFHKSQFLSVKRTFKIPFDLPIDYSQFSSKANEEIRFVFIGRFEIQKGLGTLAKALNKLNYQYAFNFDFIGTYGSDIGKAEFEQTIKSFNIIGKLPRSQVFDYLSTKKCVLVFPTLIDSYGMVVLEALQFHNPVITTVNCGASEYIVHGKSGFIMEDPFSEKELTNYLKLFLDNKNLANEFSAYLSDNPISREITNEQEFNQLFDYILHK